MNIKLVELLIEILLPIIQNLTIYYIGKSSGKNETELKFIKKNNEKLKEINELLNKKIKVSNEINNMDNDSIYSEWVY